MKLGTTTHPKFRSLIRSLVMPQYAVVGVLESLWMLACQFADDGDISRFNAQEIADYVGYDGDAQSLVDALIQSRWIDKDEEKLTIHDWNEHCPHYLHDRRRKRKDSKNKPDDSRKFQETPRDSDPTMSNQAKPSQFNLADKSAESVSSRTKYQYDETDRAIAEHIWQAILKIHPKHKPANLDDWSNDVRLMRTADGRTHREIRQIFDAANHDEFWKTNILCPAKLRKQFDTLSVRFGSSSDSDHQKTLDHIASKKEFRTAPPKQRSTA